MSKDKSTVNGPGKRIGRPPKDKSTPKGGRSTDFIGGRIAPSINKALIEYIAEFNKTHGIVSEKSSHLEKAIVLYLRAMGVELKDLPPHLAAK